MRGSLERLSRWGSLPSEPPGLSVLHAARLTHAAASCGAGFSFGPGMLISHDLVLSVWARVRVCGWREVAGFLKLGRRGGILSYMLPPGQRFWY